MPKTRLKAIMFTDIVGYTAMMQQDRELAMGRVKAYEGVLKRLIEVHQGELVQTYGDGSLSVFDSASEAVLCAKALQTEIIEQVPLRIGIHVGEITIDGDHTFGDGINISSRIESMGVAGAVLLSKEAKEKVQNIPNLTFKSLGEYRLKNVAALMEVFALANPPLIVPKKKAIKGKVTPKRTVWPYLVGMITLLALAVAGWMGILETGTDTKVREDLLTKRIAVIPFTDQSEVASLNALGDLLSDWLTNRLMNVPGTVVMRPANIEAQVQKARLQTDDDQLFAQELKQLTGVDVIVEGNYYVIDQSLIISANILNVADDQVIKSFEERGPLDNAMSVVESIGQKILGYWAVKDIQSLSAKPPAYEAYKLYRESGAQAITEPEEAIRKLQLAAEIDSSFIEPLFSLHSLYNKEGRMAEVEATFDQINQRKQEFSRWDQLRYNQLEKIRDKNWLRAAELSEQMFDLDPSQATAAVAASSLYLYANRPTKALAIRSRIDPTFIPTPDIPIDWSVVGVACAYYFLESYKQVDSVASAYALPTIPDALAVIHLHSLVVLQSERLEEVYQYYLQAGCVSTSGKPTPKSIITEYVCDKLYLTAQDSVLDHFMLLLEQLVDQTDKSPYVHRSKGFISFFQEEYAEALGYWQQERLKHQSWPGWLEKPQQIDHQSRLGFCTAMMGDSTTTRTYLEALLPHSSESRDIQSIKLYYQARIYTALGQYDVACQSLQRSVDKGFAFFRPQVFRNDPFLKALHGYPAFEAIVRPK